MVLEEMERKQTEILTWPLTCAEEAGRAAFQFIYKSSTVCKSYIYVIKNTFFYGGMAKGKTS